MNLKFVPKLFALALVFALANSASAQDLAGFPKGKFFISAEGSSSLILESAFTHKDKSGERYPALHDSKTGNGKEWKAIPSNVKGYVLLTTGWDEPKKQYLEGGASGGRGKGKGLHMRKYVSGPVPGGMLWKADKANGKFMITNKSAKQNNYLWVKVKEGEIPHLSDASSDHKDETCKFVFTAR